MVHWFLMSCQALKKKIKTTRANSKITLLLSSLASSSCSLPLLLLLRYFPRPPPRLPRRHSQQMCPLTSASSSGRRQTVAIPPPSELLLLRAVFPGAPGAATALPPTAPHSDPPATPPFYCAPYLQYTNNPHGFHHPAAASSATNPTANPVPNSGPGPNPGARLMQLFGNTAPTHLESAASVRPPSEFSTAPNAALPASSSAPLARMHSSKMPRGRLLVPGDRAVHDVDSRLPGEAEPPQLEVTPITKYVSDPGLVLGRQIAVNRTYIVYGLKQGNIRVLNINTALRSLLRGHTQVLYVTAVVVLFSL